MVDTSNDFNFLTCVFFLLVGVINPIHGLSSSSTDTTRGVVVAVDKQFPEVAKTIASSLNIPIFEEEQSVDHLDYDHVLRLVPFSISGREPTYALSLESRTDAKHGKPAREGAFKSKRRKEIKQKPFYIDFTPDRDSRMGKRALSGGGDLLVKAVGPGKSKDDGKKGAIVLDLTAGFGQDAFLLALNGAREVHMVERNPIVAALLHDAIRRLHLVSDNSVSNNTSNIVSELSKTLIVYEGDSLLVLKDLHVNPDVIYLDPMFPPRTKSAKVKKGMSLLHGLLETQLSDDTSEARRIEEELILLEAALHSTKDRVVAKRPLRALPLGGEASKRPSYSIEGSISRWDVYLKS